MSQSALKPYEELTFQDDFMFCKVLSTRPDLCRQLAELITGRSDVKIAVPPQAQKVVKTTYGGHGVRFDIYFGDDQNTVYDFEMQTVLKNELPKRTRYYQSINDNHLLAQGKKYDTLPDMYIVFICTEDPFGAGRYEYTFVSRCLEIDALYLEDGMRKIFLNAGVHMLDNSIEKISDELKAFIDYCGKNVVSSKLTQEIENAIKDIKQKEEGRDEYMTMQEMIDAASKQRYDEGMELGMKKGQLDALQSLIAYMTIMNPNWPHEKVEQEAKKALKLDV